MVGLEMLLYVTLLMTGVALAYALPMLLHADPDKDYEYDEDSKKPAKPKTGDRTKTRK